MLPERMGTAGQLDKLCKVRKELLSKLLYRGHAPGSCRPSSPQIQGQPVPIGPRFEVSLFDSLYSSSRMACWYSLHTINHIHVKSDLFRDN